jgi:hypothetical protein
MQPACNRTENPPFSIHRFGHNKRFNRMGGQMRYVTAADNRDFLLALVRGLER